MPDCELLGHFVEKLNDVVNFVIVAHVPASNDLRSSIAHWIAISRGVRVGSRR
jgi:hypothetical protein